MCTIENRLLSARLIALAPGIAPLLSACGLSDSDFPEFSTFESPGDEYHVTIDSAHSRLEFGSETIRVYVVGKEERARNHVVTAKIANDGGGNSDAKAKSKWIQPDVMRLCLSGAEQEDNVLEIYIRTLSHSEAKGNCS